MSVITRRDGIGFARGDPWELRRHWSAPAIPYFPIFGVRSTILKFRSNYVKYTVGGLKLRSPANAEIEYAVTIHGKDREG